MEFGWFPCVKTIRLIDDIEIPVCVCLCFLKKYRKYEGFRLSRGSFSTNGLEEIWSGQESAAVENIDRLTVYNITCKLFKLL